MKAMKALNKSVPGEQTIKKERAICVASVFIKKIAPDITASEAHRLGTVCLYIWTKVFDTPYYQKVKARYTYEKHVLAVLYNALDGLRVGSVYLLNPEPDLFHLLPPSKSLKQYGIKVRTYTNACHFLHEMTREMVI